MQYKIIKSTLFFQDLLFSYFRRLQSRYKSYQLPHVATNQYFGETHVSSNTTSTHRRKTDSHGIHDAFSYT